MRFGRWLSLLLLIGVIGNGRACDAVHAEIAVECFLATEPDLRERFGDTLIEAASHNRAEVFLDIADARHALVVYKTIDRRMNAILGQRFCHATLNRATIRDVAKTHPVHDKDWRAVERILSARGLEIRFKGVTEHALTPRGHWHAYRCRVPIDGVLIATMAVISDDEWLKAVYDLAKEDFFADRTQAAEERFRRLRDWFDPFPDYYRNALLFLFAIYRPDDPELSDRIRLELIDLPGVSDLDAIVVYLRALESANYEETEIEPIRQHCSRLARNLEHRGRQSMVDICQPVGSSPSSNDGIQAGPEKND